MKAIMRQSLLSCLKKSFVLIWVICCVTQCFGGPPDLPSYSKELANFENVHIKEDQLRGYLQMELFNFPPELIKEASLKPLYESETLKPILLSTLDHLIQDELVLHYGRENSLLMNDADLENAFKKQKDLYSNKELEIMLKEKDLSLSFWKNHIERQIQINHILYTLHKSSLNITAQEIKNEYNKNRDDYEVSEQVRIRHIVTDTEDKAKEILLRLKKGENFAKLALEHSQAPERSQGGDLGYFSKGQMPEVFDICFKMEKGETSEVIQSEYGYHIFKLLDKQPAHILGLDRVTDDIYQKLFAKKQSAQYQKWFDEQKQKVKIQILENNLKAFVL